MTTGNVSGIQYDVDHQLHIARERFGLKVVAKRQSWFMWLLYIISLMWIWNRKFMAHYVTTIGAVMYTPWRLGERGIGDLALVHHEVQHVCDAQRIGWAWFPAYLFPQILALGALGTIWTSWAWLALLALLPWPAPFRVWAELRGYDETFKILIYHQKVDGRIAKEWMHRTFCGWEYYRMSWRWKPIHDHFTELFTELKR